MLDEPLRARDELTAREVEVLQLVATGLTNRGIAGKLGKTLHLQDARLQEPLTG